MSFNLATILRESATAAPDKPLLHLGDQSLTYAQVDETSGRVASALLARGLEPGGTVAVHLPNLPQFVLAYFGILKAGLVMMPLNPLLKVRRGDHGLRPAAAGGVQVPAGGARAREPAERPDRQDPQAELRGLDQPWNG